MRLIRLGVILLALGLGGVAISFSYLDEQRSIQIGFDTQGGAGFTLSLIAALVGLVLIVIGLLRLRTEFSISDRRRVIVLEFRGLREWNGAPLSEAVPLHIRGRKENVLLNLRQKVRDGFIVDPERALAELQAVRSRTAQVENDKERRDIVHIVGGLAPVPLTFLLGVLLDDEGAITIMDWDRHLQAWRELTAADDGQRFAVDGVDAATSGHREVVVAVSASYSVDLPGVHAKMGAMPVVHCQLVPPSTESHWSVVKQQALTRQFLGVMMRLEKAGVKSVHLFFAGPSSLVLRFGMAYDKRNLPNVTVYQYERGEAPPFPWGVSMPVAGQIEARIER